MTRRRNAAELLDAARSGDRSAVARLLSLTERGGPAAEEVGRLAVESGAPGASHTIGMTGAPGAGKSTLTAALCGVIRRSQERVGVLAIDPSSPFSGGAILGDRVRMSDHATDDGVFIRSMATRGQLGGLTLATPAALRVLAAVGFPWIVVETVGVGQVEVDIAGAADTTVVVVNPGWGDAVQANKAGLMEIADIFVVNKADRPGAADTARDLRRMLKFAGTEGWEPPIIATDSLEGSGVRELWDAVRAHRGAMQANGELEVRRARRLVEELRGLVAVEIARRADALTSGDRWNAFVQRVTAGDLDPWSAARSLVDPGSGTPRP